jgi:hypothetical protein
MGTVSDLRQTSQDVVLDIDGELAFWRSRYPTTELHRSGRPFESYVPTLKFGYDLYLLNYRRSLDQLLPTLPARYARDVPPHERLDWTLAETLIRQAWSRMRPGQAARDAMATHAAAFASAG